MDRTVGGVPQNIRLRENRENRPARLYGRTATVRRVVELGEGQARELAHATEVEEAVRCVQIPGTRGTARGCFLELQLARSEERRVGKRVDLGGGSVRKKKKRMNARRRMKRYEW